MGIQEDIAQFEQNLNELIIKYEQYFLGVEKREPLRLLDEVERTARRFTPAQIVNYMLKFRFNSLVARLNTYKQYWNRINRLIEEGKYSRDRFKMGIHQKEGGLLPPPPGELVAATEVERVYHQFIEARKACRLPAESITPDLIAEAISRQRPAIEQKYHTNSIEFKVVIEDGKPKIKARPKSGS